MRRSIALLLTVLIAFSSVTLVDIGHSIAFADSHFAADTETYIEAEAVDIGMTVDEGGFTHQGAEWPSPPPVRINNTVFLPFISIAEAFGAAVNLVTERGSETTTATGSYMDDTFSLKSASNTVMLNGVASNHTPVPRVIDGVFYIPADLFDMLLKTETTYGDGNLLNIHKEHDGSIADLSALLGEITTEYVGNSYYNWSMAVPRKSVIVSASFTGNQISIYNKVHDILIDVAVSPKEAGETLESLLENADQMGDGGLIEAAIRGTSPNRYLEMTHSDYFSVTVGRIMIKPKMIYSVSITVLRESGSGYRTSAEIALESREKYAEFINSFIIASFPNDGKTSDLSNVVDNKLLYENYTNIPESPRILVPWSIRIQPDWEENEKTAEENLYTAFRRGEYEQFYVLILKPNSFEKLEEYFEKYEIMENENYNPKQHKIISGELADFFGNRMLDLVFTIEESGETTYYRERTIQVGEFALFVGFEAPEDLYQKNMKEYAEILNTLQINYGDFTALNKNLERQASIRNKERLADTDKLTVVENQTDGWSSKLPGYWRKSDTVYNLSYYTNYRSSQSVTVVAFDKEEDVAVYGDVEELISSYYFSMMDVPDREEMLKELEPVSVEVGKNRFTKFRLSFDPEEGDVKYIDEIYAYESEKMIYLIGYSIAERHTSEKNQKDFETFLKNFAITGKNQ